MALSWKSGWKTVYIADSEANLDVEMERTELTPLRQEGTEFNFETPTVALADGRQASAGKQVTFTAACLDFDEDLYTAIDAAEEAVSDMFVKAVGLDPTQYLILKNVNVHRIPNFQNVPNFNAMIVGGSGYSVNYAGLVDTSVST
jgi:hypothetical protein